MPDPSASLLESGRPSRFGLLCGRALARLYRVAGRHHYDDFRLETCGGLRVLVLPSVANPRLLRTGDFFASCLSRKQVAVDTRVLDLGTGSGICALAAARLGGKVIATDINPAAVRCARINALVNGLERRIQFRSGDLFTPVAEERFDLVLFNPPFVVGSPRDDREAAWCASDGPRRFARDLAAFLNPEGYALLMLSTYGDASAAYETELRHNGFRLSVHARRRYINETLTVLCAAPPSTSRQARASVPTLADLYPGETFA